MLQIFCNTSIFVAIVFVFLAVVVLATATLDMQAQLTWVAPKALLGGSPALGVISMYIVIVVRIAFCCCVVQVQMHLPACSFRSI